MTTSNDDLKIDILVSAYKEYLGHQANEIVILNTVVKQLKTELDALKKEITKKS